MSIMRTITFPGDTEPREIQDNRIEILTIDDDGKVAFTPDEIKEMVNNGKMVYLDIDGALSPINYIPLMMFNDICFSPASLSLDLGEFMGFDTKIPAHIDLGSYIINEDKTISPLTTMESETDMIQFFLPKIQDDQLGCILTNISINGIHAPAWTPIPVAQESSLGMVKAIEATPEMTEYIGIDADGQLRVAPSNDIETDETLSLAGYAADAQVVGNKLSSIPISVAEDGYTEINGLRQATQIDISKTDNEITVSTILESAVDDVIQTTSTIELDVNGFPVKITTNEIECVINWEGF